nr:hypothetical protein [Tanacetum cinerariifolium]
MLIVVPFHNLEIGDSNDPPLGLEAPPRRYSRSLLMKCVNRITRRPRLSGINGRGCSRLPPDDIQALSGWYMSPSSIHMLVQPKVQESMCQHRADS